MQFPNIFNKTRNIQALLFFLATLFSQTYLQSQGTLNCAGCPSVELSCNSGTEPNSKLYLDIQAFGNGTTCLTCCEQPSCRRVMYQVRLAIKASNLPQYNGSCFRLNYSELEIMAGVYIDEGGISNLNKKLTEICPGPGLAGLSTDGSLYTLTADEDTDITTLSIGGDLHEPGEPFPDICFTRTQTQPNTWVYYSNVLFTMAVDYFPGENIDPYQLSIKYTSGTSNETCESLSSAQITPLNNAPIPTSNHITLSLPAPTCTEEASVFPVTLNAAASVFADFLDFSVTILTDATSLNGLPSFNNYSGALGTPAITIVPLPSNTGYTIHFVYENVTLPAGTSTLFNINVIPQVFNNGTNVTANLSSGRVITASGCQAPALNVASQHCETPPVPSCPEYYFTVHPNLYFQNGNCSTSGVSVEFFGPTGFTGEMNLQIDFDLDPGMSILSATFNGTGATPTVSGNTVTLTGTNITWLVGNNFMTITFAGASGCILDGDVREAVIRLAGTPKFCAPAIFEYDFPACPGMLSGEIKMNGGCFVDDVTINKIPLTDPGTCFQGTASVLTDCAPYSTCLCPNVPTWIIQPDKNDDLYEQGPLTAEDLTAIVNHILGITPLASAYAMIGADANKSGSITTYDVVEFRKLILGIYNNTPGNEWPAGNAHSWRFVDKDFSFINPLNPFFTPFPETVTVNLPSPTADFVAIKVGSVLDPGTVSAPLPAAICSPGTCNPYARQESPKEFGIKIDLRPLKTGETITIPVYAAGYAPLVAWQMGMQFDADLLDFVGFASGETNQITAENFGLNQLSEGKIKSLWLASLDNPGDFVNPGEVLFYLIFRAKQHITQTEHLLELDDNLMACAGWLTDRTRYNFKQIHSKSTVTRDAAQESATLAATCQPNPSASDLSMTITTENSGDVALIFVDALGRTMVTQTVTLSKGIQKIPVNGTITWPSGVYHWRITDTTGQHINGQFIKL